MYMGENVWELEDNSGSWADPGIKLRSGYQAWMQEPSPNEPAISAAPSW